jgi:hypothetical protein
MYMRSSEGRAGGRATGMGDIAGGGDDRLEVSAGCYLKSSWTSIAKSCRDPSFETTFLGC